MSYIAATKIYNNYWKSVNVLTHRIKQYNVQLYIHMIYIIIRWCYFKFNWKFFFVYEYRYIRVLYLYKLLYIYLSLTIYCFMQFYIGCWDLNVYIHTAYKISLHMYSKSEPYINLKNVILYANKSHVSKVIQPTTNKKLFYFRPRANIDIWGKT